jgi:uncharacterized protein YbjT (DUF2867 family)
MRVSVVRRLARIRAGTSSQRRVVIRESDGQGAAGLRAPALTGIRALPFGSEMHLIGLVKEVAMFVIAGATGHVGSGAARELLGKRQQVKVIVRDTAKGAEWSERGAEVAVGSLEDRAFLTGALRGAQGAFVLLPPNYAAPDFYAWQRQTGDTIAAAVQAARVPHVVLLSSVGGDLAEGNGPIKGLHHLEEALRAAGTALTAIRAGYFQENVLNNLAPARAQGIFPSFIDADYALPMIATKDVAHVVAEALLAGAAKSEVVDLHGPAYSNRQIAEKLGKALGKKLQIVDIPQPAWVGALTQVGLPPPLAEAFAEMYAGLASGKVQPRGDRMLRGTTEIDEVIAAGVGR